MDKGGGVVNFSRFCADIFYGRPQTTLTQSTMFLEITDILQLLSSDASDDGGSEEIVIVLPTQNILEFIFKVSPHKIERPAINPFFSSWKQNVKSLDQSRSMSAKVMTINKIRTHARTNQICT